MSATFNEKNRLLPLALAFPVPADSAFRLDLADITWKILLLEAVSSLYSESAKASGATPPVATPVSVAVTSTVTPVAAAVTAGSPGRKVTIYNNGTSECLILEGTPVYAGGGVTYDTGIRLQPEDYYETPVLSGGAINAICRAGQSTGLTVTVYA